MTIKEIPVTKAALPTLESYNAYLEKIWATGQLTNNGQLVLQLREQLNNKLDLRNISLTANGTLALQLSIKALCLTGEIITTPYSYVATTNAILWEGCDPIFVDIDSRSFCIDPNLIEAAITPKTSAILATHVYGYPCDVEKIQAIANRHGLKVIYDAAHAFGVKLNGHSLLTHGDCSTLSFHATKLFHTAEGGAVICKEDSISRRVFLMGKFGHIGEDDYLDLGINAKMSELHAAMGLAVLPKVDEIIAARRQCSWWYDEYFANAPLQRPAIMAGLEYNYAYYPVIFPNHEIMMRARESLRDHQIFPRRYFYPPLNTLPFLRADLHKSCPIAENIATRVLCLPVYVDLSKADVQRICTIVLNEIKRG
jgi:dTDP-4-amino-4,6-dideoxygalactose transaminase